MAALDRSYTRFTPDLLPERREPAAPYQRRQEWELDPPWLRGEWSLGN